VTVYCTSEVEQQALKQHGAWDQSQHMTDVHCMESIQQLLGEKLDESMLCLKILLTTTESVSGICCNVGELYL
jgi:hypothetical protein